MDALKAAVHNGADAVYLSGINYGARKYAENFDKVSIKKAIDYAHLYDVKVYVTANTLIYEEEIEKFIDYIKFLYLSGVDAILMQDIGMINLVRKIIPDLEIHASTQTHNCNDETLKLFKDLGVKRVVLARELTLDQINNLKTDIEKEVFIHGALCICYSGCCLFSSLNGGRSGNRGMCAGPCRLPYTLVKNNKELKTEGKYLLSTRELNTSKKIKELLKSNIQSLKIEGRMKSPQYVAFITKMYRTLIDGKKIDNQNDENLKKLFNRKFTEGHLFSKKNNDLMNIKSPNNIGIEIGNVLDTGKKIKIKLNKPLSQNDGIRFKESGKGMVINKLYNNKKLLINKANKNDIIYLDNKINLKTNDVVLKTTDYLLEESLKKYELKKLSLSIKIKALLNKPLEITFIHKEYIKTLKGNVVQKSITSPMSEEKIIAQLSKLGNTPFKINKIDSSIDNNIFIPIKELNETRRKLVELIIKEKIQRKRIIPNIEYKYQKNNQNKDIKINAYITNEKQLKALIGKVNSIYTDDYSLYLKYKNENTYYRTNRTNYNLPNFENENLLLTNLGDIYKYTKNNNCKTDYFLNIVNNYSIDFLSKKRINMITLSPEIPSEQIEKLADDNTEIIVYGRLELMVMNHCLIKSNDKCPNCKNNNYYLKNYKKNLYPIISRNCQTHILNYEKINIIDKIEYLKEKGIKNFRLDFTDENPTEIINIINKVKR